MLNVSRRLSAVFIALALAAGNAVVCAGWMGTAEARMACCSEGERCPMHTSRSDDSTAVSQAEADRCCAASERRDSAPSASAFVPAIVQAVVATPVPFAAPELRPHRDAWRTLVPISATAVPKHLLLSVFLI